jgi:hypothetical protein
MGWQRTFAQSMLAPVMELADMSNAYLALRGVWTASLDANCATNFVFMDRMMIVTYYSRSGASCSNQGIAFLRYTLTGSWPGTVQLQGTFAYATNSTMFVGTQAVAGAALFANATLSSDTNTLTLMTNPSNVGSSSGLSKNMAFTRTSQTSSNMYAPSSSVGWVKDCRMVITQVADILIQTVDRCTKAQGAGIYYAQLMYQPAFTQYLNGGGYQGTTTFPRINAVPTNSLSQAFQWMVASSGTLSMQSKGSPNGLRGALAETNSVYAFLGAHMLKVASSGLNISVVNDVTNFVFPMPFTADTVWPVLNMSRGAQLKPTCNNVVLSLGPLTTGGNASYLTSAQVAASSIVLAPSGPIDGSFSTSTSGSPDTYGSNAAVVNAACPFALLAPVAPYSGSQSSFTYAPSSTYTSSACGAITTTATNSAAQCFSNSLSSQFASTLGFLRSGNTFATEEMSASANYGGEPVWLRWTWTVGAAPAGSEWLPASTTETAMPSSSQSVQSMAPRLTLAPYTLPNNTQPQQLPQIRPSVTIHKLVNVSWSNTAITQVTKTLNVMLSNVLYSNDLNQTSRACLTPDLEGTYTVNVQVTDGCMMKTAPLQFRAGCAAFQGKASINGAAKDPQSSTTVAMDKTYTTRVQLSAMGISSANGMVQVHWSVMQRTIEGTNIPFPVSNAGGMEASFVPNLATSYNVSLTVSDGCQSATWLYFVSMNCPQISPPQLTKVLYSVDDGAFASVQILRNVTSDCLPMNPAVVTYQGRVCNNPANVALPPPVAPSTQNCSTTMSYSWRLVNKPCTSARQIGVIGQSLATNFEPDVAGAYTLELLQTNGCSNTRTNVTLTARCREQLSASIPDYTVLTPCVGGAGFDTVKLQAQVSRSAKTFVPSVSCPVVRAPDAPPINQTCKGWRVEVNGPCCGSTCNCGEYCKLACSQACPGGYPSNIPTTTAGPTTAAPSTSSPGSTNSSSPGSTNSSSASSSAFFMAPVVPLGEWLPASLSRPRSSVEERINAWEPVMGVTDNNERISVDSDGVVVVNSERAYRIRHEADGRSVRVHTLQGGHGASRDGMSLRDNSTPAPAPAANMDAKKPNTAFEAVIAVVVVLIVLNLVLMWFIRRRVKQADQGGHGFDVMAADVELTAHSAR